MTSRPRQQTSEPARPAAIVPAHLAWDLWILLTACLVPVCIAQDLWLMAVSAPLLAGLGLWRTQRRGRAVLSQAVTASIAMVLAGLAALVVMDTGLLGIYAVADWLIAVAVLKCWQLMTSRDCAQVLIVAALLLLVGALVSGQLHYAISLVLALCVTPTTLMRWHLLAEFERLAKLGGLTGRPGRAGREAGSLRSLGAAATIFCATRDSSSSRPSRVCGHHCNPT
jgi:hypothetical protein